LTPKWGEELVTQKCLLGFSFLCTKENVRAGTDVSLLLTRTEFGMENYGQKNCSF
jgi:hypothetical protein